MEIDEREENARERRRQKEDWGAKEWEGIRETRKRGRISMKDEGERKREREKKIESEREKGKR